MNLPAEPAVAEERVATAAEVSEREARRWLAVLLIVVAAILARLFTWPLRLDEAYSARIAPYSLRGIVAALRVETRQPLWDFFLHAWTAWAGLSELTLRLPALLCYLLAGWATYRLGWRVSGQRTVGLYAAFFYLASSQAIFQAVNCRPYQLMGLLAALSLLWFLDGFVSPTPRSVARWGYLLVNLVGVLTHVWFFFLLLAQWVCGWLWVPRRNRWALMATQAAVGLGFLVLWGDIFLEQLRNGGTDWMPAINPSLVASTLTTFYGGGRFGEAFWGVLLLSLLLPRRSRQRLGQLLGQPPFALLWATVGLVLAVPLLVSLVHPIYYPGRYTTLALPALAAGLGWGLLELWPRSWLQLACKVLAASYSLILVALLAGFLPSPVNRYSARDDRTAARIVCRETVPGDLLLFTNLARLPMEYYLQRQGCTGRLLRNFPAEVAQHPGWDWSNPDPRPLAAEAEQLSSDLAAHLSPGQRVWVFLGSNPVENRVLLSSLGQHLRLVAERRLAGEAFDGVRVYAAPFSAAAAR